VTDGISTGALQRKFTQIVLYVGLPVALIMAAAMMAHAYDTTWIAAQQPISSSKLKANLDELQTRLAALEKQRVYGATIGSTGTIVGQTSPWISVINHSGTGSFVITITDGIFASTPTCVASAFADECNASGHRMLQHIADLNYMPSDSRHEHVFDLRRYEVTTSR